MKHSEVPNGLETPQQLADRVGVSVVNIRQLIRIGRLDHIFLSPGRRYRTVPGSVIWKHLQFAPNIQRFNLKRENKHDQVAYLGL